MKIKNNFLISIAKYTSTEFMAFINIYNRFDENWLIMENVLV